MNVLSRFFIVLALLFLFFSGLQFSGLQNADAYDWGAKKKGGVATSQKSKTAPATKTAPVAKSTPTKAAPAAKTTPQTVGHHPSITIVPASEDAEPTDEKWNAKEQEDALKIQRISDEFSPQQVSPPPPQENVPVNACAPQGVHHGALCGQVTSEDGTSRDCGPCGRPEMSCVENHCVVDCRPGAYEDGEGRRVLCPRDLQDNPMVCQPDNTCLSRQCRTDPECPGEMFCDHGRCYMPRGNGEPCFPGSYRRQCGEGLFCRPVEVGASQRLSNNFQCLPAGQSGEACYYDNEECAAGLRCSRIQQMDAEGYDLAGVCEERT